MMGLSSNQTDRPLIGLDDDTDVNHNFRQIPEIGGSTSRSQPPRFSHDGSSGVWGTVESQSYGALGSSRTNYHESARDDVYNEATVADVERIMRKYTGDLLVALDNLSLRFSQFEDKTSYLQNSMKELKISIGNNAGTTDGKLRQLENILREVQNEVHDMRDKQEIAEAQLQFTKLQTGKVENQAPSSSRQQSTQEQPVQQQQTLHSTYSVPPAPNSPALPPQQQLSFMQEMPVQIQGQSQETRYPQYQAPPPPPVAPPPSHQQQQQQQQYGPPPLPSSQQQQYGPPPPQVPHYCPPTASAPRPPLPRYHEDTPPYISENQAYPPNINQPTAPSQPPFMPSSSQFYSPGSDTFEPSTYRASFPDRYGQGGYGTSIGPRPASYFTSDTLSGGGGIYQQSPVAEVIPRARPTVPDTEPTTTSVEEIVNKVASMGFSKEWARATVNKMSQNGQSVDLNAVLDKLMNDGDIIQPHEIWRKE